MSDLSESKMFVDQAAQQSRISTPTKPTSFRAKIRGLFPDDIDGALGLKATPEDDAHLDEKGRLKPRTPGLGI